MAYHRRRTRRGPSRSKIRNQPASARNQKKQILSLSKAVNRNTKLINQERYLVQHSLQHPLQQIPIFNTYSAYYALSLNDPSFMTQIFGDPEQALGGRYTGQTMRTEYNFQVGKLDKPVDITVFIVRPKTQAVVYQTGIYSSNSLLPTAANPNPLIPGVDYSTTGGIAIMNPKRWIIDHHHKAQLRPLQAIASTVTPNPLWVGQQNQVRKSYTGKNVLKINSRTGDWRTTRDAWELPAQQRSFMLIFHDQLVPVGTSPPGPLLEVNTQFTGHTSH